ncbi:hypothetical protein ACPB9J_00895 [Streptomyces lavendulocolor]
MTHRTHNAKDAATDEAEGVVGRERRAEGAVEAPASSPGAAAPSVR